MPVRMAFRRLRKRVDVGGTDLVSIYECTRCAEQVFAESHYCSRCGAHLDDMPMDTYLASFPVANTEGER